MKTLNEWTKDELLKLPRADAHDNEKSYSSILIVTRSGPEESVLEGIAIIGVSYGGPVEIAAYHCEFINWVLPLSALSTETTGARDMQVRSSCASGSGALHVWMPNTLARIALESDHTSIFFIPKPRP